MGSRSWPASGSTWQIVPGHWTSIIPNVQNAATDIKIREDIQGRVDLAFLPGDTNKSGGVTTADKNYLECLLAGSCSYPYGPEPAIDPDRDSDTDNADVTRVQNLLLGHNTTQAWNNYHLPDRPL